MRERFGMYPRFSHCSTLCKTAVTGGVALLLAACAGETPTGVPGSSDAASTPTALSMTPGAAKTAASATNRLMRVLPTVQMMSESRRGATASGSATNSPWDLTYFGGPVVTTATSWDVYVNCTTSPAGCWGTGSLTPATFLRDLNQSDLIRVASQYLDENAEGRFAVSELSLNTTFTNNTAQQSDIFDVLASAVTATKATGYTNIYHVFLPKGTDMCIDATHCYSPNNPSTFTFCAFHGAVDFVVSATETLHVLYTVEPYQAVSACLLPTETRVIDATASALSHEFFETITDPDLDAWFNALTGNEVGDLCFGFRFSDEVGRRSYVVQEEYSNDIHDCTNKG